MTHIAGRIASDFQFSDLNAIVAHEQANTLYRVVRLGDPSPIQLTWLYLLRDNAVIKASLPSIT
jgi:hypothetical protein